MSLFPYIWIVVASFFDVTIANDNSYQSIKSLKESILSKDTYSTTLRPIRDQTKVLDIKIAFSLVGIVSLNDVNQELVTNGLLFITWRDEINQWDYTQYGGVWRFVPDVKEIWRPRFFVINTLGDHDPFGDGHSHTTFYNDGTIAWVPGGIFNTHCRLNLKKFPFDVQKCYIQLCPIGHTNSSIKFIPKEIDTGFLIPNLGWKLQDSFASVQNITVEDAEIFSCPTFHFTLERRAASIVLNVILPVVCLAALNNLIFLIPVESGERISYAVTVLLALAVFLSMVSTMTPQITDRVPALIIYLFVLLIISVVSVAAAIFTVFLHHRDEKTQAGLKSNEKFQHAVTVREAVSVKGQPFVNRRPSHHSTVDSGEWHLGPSSILANGDLRRRDGFHTTRELMSSVCPGDMATNFPSRGDRNNVKQVPLSASSHKNQGHNPCLSTIHRMIYKHINILLFTIVTIAWLGMTIWFFTFTTS